ncbi:peptidoglycan-binding protein [Calothrix sp. UHCC 0171]|uniref:peptidoglycan-binding protein n=1 Tax=Calothrix sp. UHCC 0171 TaxID=3110245 RepID=UPI002B21C760|nr:peptidoglycan-binding protein [Calothrix sp. UHCC 0171]MEA5574139.1 peptidoglycan-binding protein [Calothrix sp. UHCC 0171]
MENTVYLHLTSASNDISKNIETASKPAGLAFWSWKKLSFFAFMRFLPVALSLFIVSIAGESLAAKPGNSGAEVSNIQQCLKQLGYFTGAVTGNYGPRTQDSVTRFQRANRLPAIGSVGPQTQRLLRSQCNTRNTSRPVVNNPVNKSGVLQLGSRGVAVSNLQRNLLRLGYFNGPVNGNFGPQTQQAVLLFQRRNGITADGIVGARTQNVIVALLNPNPTNFGSGGDSLPNALNYGDRGALVQQLQQDLQRLGFLTATPNGIFGPATREAVTRFQTQNGLIPNGIADSQTLIRISQVLASNPNNPNNPNPNDACSSAQGNICVGERSQRVVILQQRLQQWQVYGGNADGFYGPATRDAVAQFQRSSGLPMTGFVDFRTWQALGFTNNTPNIPNVQNPTSNNRYIVVVPIFANDTLNRIRQFIPQAIAEKSRKGDYVNAGAFVERSDAERLSNQLRDRGFDARVEYF